MAAMLSLDDLEHAAGGGDIDTVLVAFVDLQGRLIGKRCHVRYFLDSGHEEAHGCDYLLADDLDMEPVPGYAATSWATGYGDFLMKPDLETLRPLPWLEKTALVLCDVQDEDGKDLPHSPRGILKRQIARLKERGYEASCATELEFYLFDDDYRTAHDKGYRDLVTAGYYIQDYHILQTSKEEGVMRAIRNGLQGAGIPVESTKGEWGPGQEEVNIVYSDALAMADRHAILKNGIKEIAYNQGKAVTFMAKWAYELAGSSSHVHLSLNGTDGTPVFLDKEGPHSMSKTMQSFVAGMLRHSSEITWLLAPYVNSYKRFQAGTFAPTKAIWAKDNRTAGYRLCSQGSKAQRIECRIGGADLNPYFAIAGLIAAGLKGLEDEAPLDPPFEGDAYSNEDLPEIPKTLRDAMAAMDKSAMLREAFGDAAVDHLVHTARWEQTEYDRRVTDWEVKRGFERA